MEAFPLHPGDDGLARDVAALQVRLLHHLGRFDDIKAAMQAWPQGVRESDPVQAALLPVLLDLGEPYDVLGRCTQEIVDSAGVALTSTYEYDAIGNVVLKRDPLGFGTRYVYDAVGRLKYTIDALCSVVQRLLCAPEIRRHVRVLTERLMPHLRVLAITEVPNNVNLKSFGSIGGGPANRGDLTRFTGDGIGQSENNLFAQRGIVVTVAVGAMPA